MSRRQPSGLQLCLSLLGTCSLVACAHGSDEGFHPHDAATISDDSSSADAGADGSTHPTGGDDAATDSSVTTGSADASSDGGATTTSDGALSDLGSDVTSPPPSDAAADVAPDASGCSTGPGCAAGSYCTASGACATCNTAAHCGASCIVCSGTTPSCDGTACTCDATSCGAGATCSGKTCVACTTTSSCGPSCAACSGTTPTCGGATTGCTCTVSPDSCGGTSSWCTTAGSCAACGASACGNGRCDCGETAATCSADCHATCPTAVTIATWTSGDDGWTYSGLWSRDTASGWMNAGSTISYSSSYTQNLTYGTNVDLSACKASTLHFSVRLQDDPTYGSKTDKSERLYVMCSGDGGTTWNTIAPSTWPANQSDCGTFFCSGTNSYDRSFPWTDVSISLPAACITAKARFRFQAKGENVWNLLDPGWSVDTVSVN